MLKQFLLSGVSRGVTRAKVLAIVAGTALLIAVVVPALVPRAARVVEDAQLAACKDNLRRIGVGMLVYLQENGNALPVSDTVENPHLEWVQAMSPKYVSDPKLFYCPSEQRPELSYSKDNFAQGVIGYYYYSAAEASEDGALSRFLRDEVAWPRELKAGMDEKSWVMSDIWVSGEPTAHRAYKKGVNYLMLSGAVGFIETSPRQAFH